MKIKTAEEVLDEFIDQHKIPWSPDWDKFMACYYEAMKKYAEQFIDLSYHGGFSDGRRRSGGWEVNQKESILKIKQLIK